MTFVPDNRTAYPIKVLTPGPAPIPPKGVTAQVECGDGAVMAIVNPFHDYSIEWQLRYGNATTVRFVAASLLSSYDYLLSHEITATEAIRRLRLMRARRAQLLNESIGITPPPPQERNTP